MEILNTENLILASKSPRRKHLLEQVGINIKISPSNIDEGAISIQDPEEYVKTLSFLKADKTALIYPHSWILGADTIVVVQDQILGKPKSKTQAFEMLNNLNNCEHSVYTGFCLLNQKQGITIKQSVETNVFFKSLSTSEINWYINTGEPFDKAGAYAIQGIGAFLIHRICGSYSNVVGLPVCEVIQKLMELNIIQFKDKDHHVIHQN